MKKSKFKKYKPIKDYNEDDLNSFLASPKMENTNFMNDSTAFKTLVDGDSSTFSRITRSKAASQYDVRCKHCLKLFESVDLYLKHQMICN